MKGMYRWRGRTAVVTGAASGIGAAITDLLLEEGINVAALDIQYDRLEEKNRKKIAAEEEEEKEDERKDDRKKMKTPQTSGKISSGKLFPIKCDLNKENEIFEAFDWIKNNLTGVDIMINNAGIIDYSKVIESDTETFRKILDINVLAVAICSKEAVASMRARDVEGHVFIINSLLGHEIPQGFIHKGWNLYPSCKHATVALATIIRRELIDVKAKVRMTSISPGLVKTEITSHTPKLRDFFEKTAALLPSDIAEGIIYALGTRPEVQVTELMIRRTGEP